MKIKFTKVTNTEGLLNKTFSIDLNGQVKKESNAFFSMGRAEVVEVNNLNELYFQLENLQPNQAIISGITDETLVNIVKKGEEYPPFYISRSNKYFKYPKPYGILLGDYDPDKAMPEHMKLKTFHEFYNVLCKILPPQFAKVECLIISGSSNGIKNSSGELVYDSGSQHGYWTNWNLSDENIDKLIEHIKRASILHNLYYLKIFKDGSVGMRYAIDLSVLKSASSRLIFEAKPTCKNDLYQDRPQSLIWNKDSQKTLDLSKISYDHLPDWKPIYERLKIEHRELIQQTKEAYKASKIQELVQKGFELTVAINIADQYIKESTLSVKTLVEF
ncbi:hypothetical protein [Aliarcobacter cryaerophilus]|uniref:hypothetical protein n=1 Tax=Aliarcobacter cryaerophilus TaxID=28198 RepID=UPI0021B2B6EE|nr:hypothetical protein [Aliarcobacter cryaerophilus]MCT7515030.1 hypothetical protein [Aliarcobacter cryaerophilus]